MQRESEGIAYILTKKRVKNLNLRVDAGGEVRVSAPARVSLTQIDAFVASRAGWIARAKARMEARAQERQAPDAHHSPEECLAVFTRISAQYYPLFAGVLAQPPALRVREMKSRWGGCHVSRGYITLNSLLLNKPLAAIEYVVLHEYVHFLHPNHQKGFHDMMAALMPDYQKRRALLRANYTE